MKLRQVLGACAVLIGVAGYADACGPDFPTSLIFTRSTALHDLPANSFAREVAAFVPAAKNFLPDPNTEAHEKAERAMLLAVPLNDSDLDAAKQADIVAERADLRAYIAGAEEFLAARERLSDAKARADLAAAAQAFQAVSQSPAAKRIAVRAGYMLGRSEALRAKRGHGDARCEIGPAIAAFGATRQMAAGGLPDRLGLGLSSFGEEAKVYLDLLRSGAVCAGLERDDAVERMVMLYAEQAARGDDGGIESLRIVAGILLDDADLLAAAMQKPLPQRLVAIYLIHKLSDWTAESTVDMAIDAAYETETVPDRLARFLAALDALPDGKIAEADRLAAILYKAGRYDHAARMLQRANGPLGDWIGAKLALRGNDPVRAATLLVKAQRGLEAMGDAVAPAYLARLKAEQGIVALNRDDIAGAMRALFAAGGRYWEDIAYLGERVMTLAELRSFVDPLPKGPRVQPPPDRYGMEYIDVGFDLRYLLARRLAREGDLAAAKLYMPETIPDDYWHKDVRPAIWLGDYAAALERADKAWLDSSRAEGLFAAAMLQRRRGMEVFGYELHPDYKTYEGGFGSEQGVIDRFDLPAEAAPTKQERERFEATRPKQEIRFHYRYRAADMAVQAADLLPPRSQAYAAVLCHATRWMLQSNAQERAAALYQRYLRAGAYVSWGKDFGRKCPAPDFDAARSFRLRQAWPETRVWLRGLLR